MSLAPRRGDEDNAALLGGLDNELSSGVRVRTSVCCSFPQKSLCLSSSRCINVTSAAGDGDPGVETAFGVQGLTLLDCLPHNNYCNGIPVSNSISDPEELRPLSIPDGFLRRWCRRRHPSFFGDGTSKPPVLMSDSFESVVSTLLPAVDFC